MKLPWFTLRSAAALFATLCLVASVRANSFEDANRAFAQGHFTESIRGYESVLKQDGYSPEVLFNLGNAHLRAGQPGEAILDYERARWLAPREADIAANLRLARERAGLASPGESWLGHAASFLAPNGWAWLASVSLVAFCAGVLGAQLWTRRRTGCHLLTAVSAVVLLGSAGAIALDYHRLEAAILPAQGTVALISPFEGARTVFTYPAGESVRVEKVHGQFCLVRDASGHAGWVPGSKVGRIVPDSTAG